MTLIAPGSEPIDRNGSRDADRDERCLLRDRGRQFQFLVSAVSDYALYMLDPQGHIVSWNSGAHKIKGYSEAEVIGQHFSLFYTEADRAADVPMRCLEKAANEGRFQAEVQRVRKDGSLFWANVSIEPIRDGQKLIGFVKITRDITKRLEAQERLKAEITVRREAERQARAARQRLLDAINCIKDGFALFDQGDHLLVANQRFLQLHSSVRDHIRPGVRFEDLVRAGLMSDPSVSGPKEGEVLEHLDRHTRSNGTPRIWQSGQKWLMTAEQRTLEGGVVIVETDITELKRSELAKDEFLAMVSHELRTPLTPIYGALGLIASGELAEKPDRHAALIAAARSNCERLMLIVNDLLDITKINAGKCSIERESMDLLPAVKSIIANKRMDGVANRISLSTADGGAGFRVRADRRRIQQVFDNLLSNAIKFSKLEIHVHVARVREKVRVSVADQGCGIPAAFYSKIFNHFSQSDSSLSRRKGGLGLGLALSKAIVEAHEGTIGFKSAEGVGSTFYFELPLADARAESPSS